MGGVVEIKLCRNLQRTEHQKRVEKRLQIALETVAGVKAALDQTSLNSALKFNDFQMHEPPYFEPRGTPKSPNWRPKKARKQFQDCFFFV